MTSEEAKEAEAAAARRRSILAGGLIDPMNDTWIARWDMVAAIALIVTFISVPFEVGFLDAPTRGDDPLFVMNRLIDCIFLTDMFFQFFTMVRAA